MGLRSTQVQPKETEPPLGYDQRTRGEHPNLKYRRGGKHGERMFPNSNCRHSQIHDADRAAHNACPLGTGWLV